jgi:hypothetical protein
MLDFGGAISGIGAGIGQIMSAEGYRAQAEGYRDAARMSRTMGDIRRSSGRTQLAAQRKEFLRTKKGQRSDIAGAGFQVRSGTGLTLLADTIQQGRLARSLIKNQTSIDLLEYKTQTRMYKAEAEAADAQAEAATVGGALGIVGSVLGMFSDPSLKHDIKPVGTDADGKQLYEYSYIGSKDRYVGYMAPQVGSASKASGVSTVAHRFRARRAA